MSNVDDFTTLDHRDRRYMVVPAAIVEDHSPDHAPGEASWCGHVCDAASPLAGLYAFADSPNDVQDALARLAWAVTAAGELAEYGITTAELEGVYVVSTTCSVYEADHLAASLANDAA